MTYYCLINDSTNEVVESNFFENDLDALEGFERTAEFESFTIMTEAQYVEVYGKELF